MIKALGLDQIIGHKFLEFEQLDSEHSGSGADEVVLHFENGKEISIYLHEDGTLCIEGD